MFLAASILKQNGAETLYNQASYCCLPFRLLPDSAIRNLDYF